MTTIERTAPPVDQPRSKREIYTVMSGLLIAMLLAILDNLVVGTAMPTIVGELGGLAHLSWVVTAYALATAVSTPVWAKLGDLYGRKGVFMASIVLFLAGSALAGLSQNMSQLIGFRGLQGLGAGGLMVGAMAIIADLVPLRERGRYQGLMTAVMPLAFIGGPLLGGFLTDNLSWRWAFYINLPLGVLALVVVALTMHLPGRRQGQVSIDWRGAGLLAAGIAALTLLTSWGGTQYAWSSAPIIILGVVTVAALGAFVALERRVTEPILSLALFRSRNFSAATILTLFTGFALFGAMTFLPQFQQNVQGASATSSGLLLLPLMAGMLTTSLLGGQLVTRTGRYRALLIAGAVMLTAGLGLLATMSTTTSPLTTSMYMVALGAGMGLLMQTTQLVAQNSVAQRDIGAASGAVTLFRTLGGSLGVSLLGTLFGQRVQSTLAGSGAPAGQIGSGHVTPGMLAQLPAPLRDAYQTAITSGVQQVFLWAALIAVLGLIAAWVIQEAPLRGSEPPAVPDGAIITPDAATVISGAVRRDNGSPLVGTPLTLIDPAGREIAVGRTGSDGSYRLPVPIPGAYLLVASATGFHPAASRVTVANSPVRHEIVLLAPESAPIKLPQDPEPPQSWRKPGLVLTALSGLIVAVTFALWPASTNSPTTASAAPPIQGPAVPLNQDPAAPRHEDIPTTTDTGQPAPLRTPSPSLDTSAVDHRLPTASTPAGGHNSTTGAQVLVLRDVASRWQPAADPHAAEGTPAQPSGFSGVHDAARIRQCARPWTCSWRKPGLG
jgi:EmrB/QacA subfamily drug resistance transporter